MFSVSRCDFTKFVDKKIYVKKKGTAALSNVENQCLLI